jgi:hypothetical protein
MFSRLYLVRLLLPKSKEEEKRSKQNIKAQTLTFPTVLPTASL